LRSVGTVSIKALLLLECHLRTILRCRLRAGALRRINAACSPHPSGSPDMLPRESAEGCTMLWDASMMTGYAMRGSDGEVGTVRDLLFDDASWRIRWVVVNTRQWLPSHDVLLPGAMLGRPDPVRRRLAINLTVRQIEDSLDPTHHLPVSQRVPSQQCDDPYLRSVDAVVGHRVHLLDGLIGHVEEVLVDDADWTIRYVRVDTCKWRPGGKVLLAPRFVREIDWDRKLVRFAVSRREIEGNQANLEAIWMRSANDDGALSNA
jgi:hypothetical protein